MMEQKITEVVAALIVKDHRFLICQRPAHKARGLLWEFVGGKVEPGETLPQALIRECREELGIRVTPQPGHRRPVSFQTGQYSPRPMTRIRAV